MVKFVSKVLLILIIMKHKQYLWRLSNKHIVKELAENMGDRAVSSTNIEQSTSNRGPIVRQREKSLEMGMGEDEHAAPERVNAKFKVVFVKLNYVNEI